jgi:hypothetical protein
MDDPKISINYQYIKPGLNNKKEMNLERRRIEKIFTQINKIGSKGRDNELEYKKYVDDIVARGDYDNLLQCLYYYYDIDTQNPKVEDVKRKT